MNKVYSHDLTSSDLHLFTKLKLFPVEITSGGRKWRLEVVAERAPFDLHLLTKLKMLPVGRKLKTDEGVIVEVEQYFDNLDAGDYKCGIMSLRHCWSNCINVERELVEKKSMS